MRAWLGGVGAAALLLLVGACGDSDGDEAPPPVEQRPDVNGGQPDGGDGTSDGGTPDAGPPDSGDTAGGAVLGVWTYGDALADRAGPVAHHEGTGDLLLALHLGRGRAAETPSESHEHLRLMRRTARGDTVWTRTLVALSDSFPEEMRQVTSKGLAFTPDGGAWALLSWRGGNVDLGTGPLVTGDYLVRLSATGDIQHVRKLVTGRGIALTEGLAVDADGGVVVTGQFFRTVDFGGGPVESNREEDGRRFEYTGYVVRYAADGSFRWVRTFGGLHGFSGGHDVAVDASTGEVLVGGMMRGEAAFAGVPIPGDVEPNESRGVLARLSADGSLRWVKTVGEEVRHVAFSPRGTAVAAGRGETVRWSGQEATGNPQRFLVTAEVDGTERVLRTFAAEAVTGLGVDAAGGARLLVQGLSNTDLGGGPEEGTPPSPTYLVRMSLDGSRVWTRELHQWLELDEFGVGAPHLALANDGTAWVLGTFAEPWSAGGTQLTPVGSTDVYLLQAGP
ncbi:hypothetical protein HPC49_03635 [Pyxidicoccus fallax]|uniref:Lipoprotein n=1 Tax=Pyxidicoccus fallax TaxID=394095 RepID=A0A848LR14_9BACT|nr:hypothetical protein [Pyxidicoccus fallax]NMO20080.1 hypothetical protein [Pyxidicoccus fallax]NPC77348.1 hypothetical protein [Pyxidicoccus fallax]